MGGQVGKYAVASLFFYTLPTPLRSVRRNAPQDRFGILPPPLRSGDMPTLGVLLRNGTDSTSFRQCRRRKNEKKRRGKGISRWLVAVCHKSLKKTRIG